MSKYRMYTWTCLTLLVLTIVGTLFPNSVLIGKVAHAASAQKCGQWSIIPSTNPTPLNELNDVAAISANDVWTVGSRISSGSMPFSRTLAEHWNGKEWKVISTPNSGAYPNVLRSVVAFSTNNVWAVGAYADFMHNQGYDSTLFEHWDGTTWKIIAAPNAPESSNNELLHIAAASVNDIWAVGYYTSNANIFRTLIEHWNGTAWKVVQSPNIGKTYNNMLNSVAVVSANDVWSVGSTIGGPGNDQTVIEHWNGSSWHLVSSRNPGSGNYLEGIGIISTNNVWAVGGTENNSGEQTLVEHWDGKSWKVVASPSPMSLHFHATPNAGGEPMMLFGVAVISANSIWAVGDYPNNKPIYRTLIEHWDGKTWSIIPSPNVDSISSYLRNAARVGNTAQVWAVGFSTPSLYTANTLTEFYC